MVSSQDKVNAVGFICDRLEGSGLYVIHARDHQSILVREKAEVREEPRIVHVVIPNFFTFKDYKRLLGVNRSTSMYTAPIHYKDGKTAFVRLVDSSSSGWRRESMKYFTEEERAEILHLRDNEQLTQTKFGGHITYYQPSTKNQPEALIDLRMDQIPLKYDYIKPAHPAYEHVSNRFSKDYRYPEKVGILEPAVQFRYSNLIARPVPAEIRQDLIDRFALLFEEEKKGDPEAMENVALALDHLSKKELEFLIVHFGRELLRGFLD